MQFRLVVLLPVALSGAAAAQVGIGPQPAPPPPPIPAPRDASFDGTIALAVDATDTRQKVFRVHEVIPVQAPGDLILLYPEWETSSHAATASVSRLAGLMIHAVGQRIEWRRDPVDPHAFHIAVPVGAPRVELDFQYLSPASTRSGATVITPDLANVQWHSMLLYPAGWFARDLAIAATLTLPAGFRAATSLVVDHAAGGTIAFRPTNLEALVDSPVYAGRYVKQLELASGPAVTLDLLADAPADLEIPAGELAKLRALVEQTRRLFRAQHYDRYHFLVSLSDRLPSGGGLEHLESSENNLPAGYFLDLAHQLPNRDLLAHEYVHSWNGRFRQPADLWTPNFNVPMRNSLLWVYEGLTEFWGRVLGARAGLRTQQDTLDQIALDAATAARRIGRSWKSLQDSTNDPLFVAGHPIDWRDWQRREDYYPEGVMLWLDIDGRIRQQTAGNKSLDDVARSLFGIHDASRVTVTYTFADICAALEQVAPDDWATLLRQRLDRHDDRGLLDGLTRGGYRLVYTDTPTEAFRQAEVDGGAIDLSDSIGLAITPAGIVRSVAWNGPAFVSGITPGAHLVSVNGKPYDPELLKAAIQASATTPLDVACEEPGRARTVRIDYRGSLRYPRLARIAGTPDRLGQLLAPLLR